MLDLQPMNEADFKAFMAFLVEDYAQDIARNQRIPIETARERSVTQTGELLHAGLATPKHFLYNVVLNTNAAPQAIGYLWLEVDTEKSRCFIYDIYLQPEHRGQGRGKQTLQLLEEKMQAQGIGRIGLHVFGHNTTARALYEKMGYEITGINMQKLLG